VCATAWSGGEGALASLFHLATLGLIQVRLSGSMALKRTRASELQAGENVQTPTGATVSVPTHLATLFNALQPVLPAAEETPFYKIETQFQNVLPRVYAEMGAEATRFFDELPDTARRRWLVLGQWLVLLGIGAAVVLALWLRGSIGWVAVAPAVGLTVLGFALIGMSRWMPRRTNLGTAILESASSGDGGGGYSGGSSSSSSSWSSSSSRSSSSSSRSSSRSSSSSSGRSSSSRRSGGGGRRGFG